MNLRKPLVAAAAIVAAGLMAVSGSALAGTGSASGSSTGTGTASFAGGTYSCPSGSVGGTYDDTNNPAYTFSSMNITCSTPIGNATISLNCAVPVNLTAGRTSSTSDTGITGNAVFGTSTCVQVTALFGVCTANVHGTVSAAYNESTAKLTLNGVGTLSGPSPGCGGVMTGTFTLNGIEFAMSPKVNFL